MKCECCDIEDSCNYFDKEEKWLSCSICGGLFKKKILSNTSYFYTDIKENLPKKQEIKKRILSLIDRRFYDLVADQYIDYLKSKTNMKFKNAFDIGAMLGNFIVKLNESGINATGIEPGKESVELAVTDKIEWGYFDENYESRKHYDLICLTQMLYYVQDPYALLKKVKTFLNPNGLIFISTYNPSSHILKNPVLNLLDNNMNILFSRKNFESLKTNFGLELIDYTTIRPDLYLYMSTRPVNALNLIKRHLNFYFKKSFVQDNDGYHAFLLLKLVG